MNMFEIFDNENEELTYGFGVDELNSKIQNIIYTSDTVKASYFPRKDIIECGFWQDDIRVYLTFVSTNVSDFSESFSNEALTAVTSSDANCDEKFEEIFRIVFGVNFERAVLDVSGVFSKGTKYSSASDLKLKYVDFYAYYHNTQISVCFMTENKSEVFSKNTQIKKLANKMINYDERLANI